MLHFVYKVVANFGFVLFGAGQVALRETAAACCAWIWGQQKQWDWTKTEQWQRWRNQNNELKDTKMLQMLLQGKVTKSDHTKVAQGFYAFRSQHKK